MKMPLLLPLIVGTVAITGMVFTFVTGASPYVTIAEAKTRKANNLHLTGEMVKSSVQTSVRERTVRFTLIDETGASVPVLYKGNAPANMGEATKVVVIGGMNGDVFESERMLLKCPSKYEAEK